MRIADPDQLSSVLARLDIAVVALDVDGTLLTSAHRITPRLVTAVTAARAAGVSIVLASSRGPSVLRPILDGLGLATDVDFVASGGGYLGRRDTDGQFRAVARRTMSIQAARAFAAQVLTCGLAVNWFAGERWWATSRDAGVAYEIAAVGVEPPGGVVVEEKQRHGPAHGDVVDAVVDEVLPDRLVPPGEERDLELRADAVHRRHEHGRLVGREVGLEERAERADAVEHAGGERLFDERLDAADGLFARVDVHACVAVGGHKKGG